MGRRPAEERKKGREVKRAELKEKRVTELGFEEKKRREKFEVVLRTLLLQHSNTHPNKNK